MEKSQAAQAIGQVVKFAQSARVEIEAEVVESAFDELRNMQVYALLNNSVIVMDSEFKTTQRCVHEGGKKINAVKLNEGLICIAGEDNAATFYDPREQKAVKRIQSKPFLTSEADCFRCRLQQARPCSRQRRGSYPVLVGVPKKAICELTLEWLVSTMSTMRTSTLYTSPRKTTRD